MNKVLTWIKEKKMPYVTVGLIVLNVVYFLIVAIGGNPTNTMYMLSRGAQYAPLVFEEHEYWRLLTSMFLHFSLRHLFGNMIYLGIAGWTYEPLIGHIKFFLIYMLSGIGGNVVSCAYYSLSGQHTVAAGASGAVYGLIGMVIYLMYTARKRTHQKQLTYRMLIMLAFLFYSNFASGGNIDIAAHLGGLAFGIVLSIFLLPHRKKGGSQK